MAMSSNLGFILGPALAGILGGHDIWSNIASSSSFNLIFDHPEDEISRLEGNMENIEFSRKTLIN